MSTDESTSSNASGASTSGDASGASITAGAPSQSRAEGWLGAAVRLRDRPAYLKTAEPMPMLRPPDLVGIDEVGLVVEERALQQLAVRFRRGTFLIAAASCEPVEGPPGRGPDPG